MDDGRGLMKDSVHIAGVSCAFRPTLRAISFSRSIRACVSALSGCVNRELTERRRALVRPVGAGRRGRVTEAKTLSTRPEAR